MTLPVNHPQAVVGSPVLGDHAVLQHNNVSFPTRVSLQLPVLGTSLLRPNGI